MKGLSRKIHTFEEIMSHDSDEGRPSDVKVLKLIDLVKGCLNPETEKRTWVDKRNPGQWVQYKIPNINGERLFVSLFYTRLPGISREIAEELVYGNENPGIAEIVPDSPLREILLFCEGKVAINIKHVIIDGQHMNIMSVIGQGFELDYKDKRTAKVVILLLGYGLDLNEWPIIWANYSIGRLIADMQGRGDHKLAVPVTENGKASMRCIALGLADITPIINFAEVLA
jgi:hypothetical protein